MHGNTVFEMVRQVLNDSREKLAEAPGVEKTAAPQSQPRVQASNSGWDADEFLKIADACDYLAENIHTVTDTRTPVEKLAEYTAIHEALMKEAVEGGPHQTQKSTPESDPPKNPPLDSGITPGGPNSAMVAMSNQASGTSLDAGESGEAMSAHQSPKGVVPTEKTIPADAGNALETNKEMMMPEQPEAVLKQAQVNRTMLKVAAHRIARKSGLPEGVILRKLAAVADNPPSPEVAGTSPILQSSAGVPSALSQGSEAGENTPRETAPATGEGVGRNLVATNEAAMNATKGQAKTQNARAALDELLTEKAMSPSGDKVLQKSLDNTPAAGVKISAARELLRKFASSSPENAAKVKATLAKLAMEPAIAGAGAAPEGGPEPVSEEALEAAKAGVTPEEVEQAEQMLTAQTAAALESGDEGDPGLGGEKDSMMGMGAPAPSMGAAPAAPGMM